MHIVVFITCADKKEARRIARALVINKLAACVNIIDKIESIFWWQGKVDRAKETLLIIKSKKSRLSGIIKRVKAIHSYKVPEIIALPIIAGSNEYLDWINESTR